MSCFAHFFGMCLGMALGMLLFPGPGQFLGNYVVNWVLAISGLE